MPIFKKNKKNKKDSFESEGENTDPELLKEKTKKKIKIGFGHKDKKSSKEVISKEKDETKAIESEPVQIINKPTQLENSEKTTEDYKDLDVFLDDLASSEEKTIEEPIKPEEREEWSKSKRKTLIQKDMRGKPVYLEDTGEKIGSVFEAIYDKDKNLIGYKIKDSKSKSILSFPIDQFDEDKNGLIFVPSWYTKGIKTIEKLEFKDRISPELTWLITDNTVSNDELYRIFAKHDDKITNYIEDAVALRELLSSRLKILEKERVILKENLMDLTEKRLIKDIDRRKFSEIVMEHRRKVNVIDVNIKKCKELIERLENTSFGILSKNMISNIEKEEQKYQEHHESFNEKDSATYDNEIEDPYKDKYYDLKECYEELKEEHDELKIAVEKLLNKDEIYKIYKNYFSFLNK